VKQAGLKVEFSQDGNFTTIIYRPTPQDIQQDTMQDKSLNINQEDNFTMQDTMQATMQVTMQAVRVYRVVGDREMSKQQIMKILNINNADYFRLNYLQPALEAGLIERTIPDKPTSGNQKYRKTKKAKELNL